MLSSSSQQLETSLKVQKTPEKVRETLELLEMDFTTLTNIKLIEVVRT